MLKFGNTFLHFGGTYLTNVAGVVTSFLNPNVVVKASKLNESTNLHIKVLQEKYNMLMFWPTESEEGNEYTYSPKWNERYQSDIVPSDNLWSGTMTSTPVNECWVYTSPCNADSTPVKRDLSIVSKENDTPITTYSAVSWPESTGTSTITLYGLNPEVTATSSTIVSICFDRFNSAAQYKPREYMVDCSPLSWNGGVYSVERADLGLQAYAFFNDSGCYRISNMTAFNTTALVGTWDIKQGDDLRRRHFPLQIKDTVFSGNMGYDQCLFTYEARNVSSYAEWNVASSQNNSTFYAHNLINCSGVTVLERSKTSAYQPFIGGDEDQNYDNTSGMFNTVGWWENNGVWTYNDNSAYNPLSSDYRQILSSHVLIDPDDDKWRYATIRDSMIELSGNGARPYKRYVFYKANISNSRFWHISCTASGSRLMIPESFYRATFNNVQIGSYKLTGSGTTDGYLDGTWSLA